MPSITASRAEALSIGRLSQLTGVNIETIRYYEKIRLLPAPPRTAGGRRVYAPVDRRRLAFIRRARQLGFALDDIRALLALGGPGQAACSDVCAIATRHIADIRARIADLRRLERVLGDAVGHCSGAPVPACAVLDVLYPDDAGA